MTARNRILERLRDAQQPFLDIQPIGGERRHMIALRDLTPQERVEQFVAEAEALGSVVYHVDKNSAVEQIMELIGSDQSVMSWEEGELPLAGLPGILESLGVTIAGHNDGDVRVGITGVSAALAATGSLVLESGAGRYRATSLLPDLHIALLTAEQILPDLETWQQQQHSQGYPAFTRSSNTTIVSGPSKTADIGHQLVKGAHGPRELHIMILR